MDDKKGYQWQQHMVEYIQYPNKPGSISHPKFRGQNPAKGEKPQLEAEDPEQQQGKPGDKQGIADKSGYGQDIVQSAPLVPYGYFSQQHPGKGGQNSGRGKEENRPPQPFPDNLKNRLSIVKGNPEIACKKFFR